MFIESYLSPDLPGQGVNDPAFFKLTGPTRTVRPAMPSKPGRRRHTEITDWELWR